MRFRVLTFVTDEDQYRQMSASFVDAGFTADRAALVSVDNTGGNVADPYSALGSVLCDMDEDVLVVCHQDIRLDRGAGYRELVQQLASAGDRWGVAGPAGMTEDFQQALSITDPWDAPRWGGAWPVQVQSLDELFIAIRPGRASLTPGLEGFHFYGLDLCLSARRNGWNAVAIDFPLTHLSDGRRGQCSPEYRSSRDALQRRLSPFYRCTLAVSSTGEGILLSRSAVLRRLGDRGRVHEWLKARVRRP